MLHRKDTKCSDSLVWLADRMHSGGRSDKVTVLSSAHKNKMFWDRNTTASPGSRQLEQKRSDRDPGLQSSLARAHWGQGKEESTQTQGKASSNRNITWTGACGARDQS